jgi:hypothetical protein
LSSSFRQAGFPSFPAYYIAYLTYKLFTGMNYMDESQSDYHCIERHVAYVREVIKGQIEQLLNAKEDHLQNLSLCDKYKSESEQLRLEIQVPF